MPTEDEELRTLAKCLIRMEKRHGAFKMECTFSQMSTLIAMVQMAMRNPKCPPFAAKQMRTMMEQIIEFVGCEEPEFARIMRRGWEPGDDVAVGDY